MSEALTSALAGAIKAGDGILRLDPAWVARDWLPPGRRLGLNDEEYDVGERGQICERWLASVTHAANRVGPPDEGISYIRATSGERLNLADALAAGPALVLGGAYAATHSGLGRLAKIFDFGARIPFHIHPPLEYARRVGRNPKDEAYFFPPGQDMGPHPETFLGLHPSADREHAAEAILDELVRWDGDEILRLSRAYRQIPQDGFFIPSGVLHAPGTALTLELQEDSDTLAMFQALNAGTIIDKEMLFKDVCSADRHTHGEAALLDWVDWPVNNDPYFYENHHTPALPFRDGPGVTESWIFYGSTKFSGKRLVLEPGARDICTERGVFSLLVWEGSGTIGGNPLAAGHPGDDELLVVDHRARQPLEVVNTGHGRLMIIKMFGPDINPDSPTIPARS